ncbi:MAG: hypothetical protein AABX93_01245 [Nanoarchaeota archaeon]
MPIDFSFRSIELKNLDETTQFVASQNLGYPNYEAWIEKMRSELSFGIKHGILAYNNGIIVGDIVFQKHKQLVDFLELKNIRIHPNLRGRNFASFMLRQAELEMPQSPVIVDARVNQADMINFLISQGYSSVTQMPLYDSHNQDIVMVKLRNETKDGILTRVKSLYN